MRTFKDKTVKVLDKIYCDICGSCCTDINFGSEYATLEAMWGYTSKKDGSKYEIHICEDCFDKTIKWMKTQRTRNLNIDNPESNFGENNIFDIL